jgi:CSLREA domain-containing protein
VVVSVSGALAAGLIFAATAPPAAAAPTAGVLTFTVNSTVDAPDVNPGSGVCADSAGQCTLRAAVQASDAAPAGTSTSVTVPTGTYALSLGALLVTVNTITVRGAGAAHTVIKNAKAAKNQLVSVSAKAKATFASLELTGGTPGNTGGGALTNSGITTLTSVIVTKNVSASGGGINNASGATLTLNKSTVSSNSATSAATDSAPGNSGGGIVNAGRLQVTGTTVASNRAGSGGFGGSDTGGRGGNGGGIVNSGTVVITSSTIKGNAAGSGGLGLSGQEVSGPGGSGGGIYSSGGTVTLTKTTVSGNASGYSGTLGEAPFPNAGNGGGVWSSGTLTISGSNFTFNVGETGTGTGGSGGAVFNSGRASITNSTFTSNAAGFGDTLGGNGGAIDNTGTLTLSGSTIDKNSAGSGGGSANGGAGGGLYFSAGSATLSGDTLNTNKSGTGGNAIPVDPGCSNPGVGGNGGAVYSAAALNIVNTTLSGNSTGEGGFDSPPCAGQAPSGVGAGLAAAAGSASVSFSTIANNSDGIDNLGATVTLLGTIVADSTGDNCTGVISETAGYNLDSGSKCGFSAATDISGKEPLLAALAGNGGSTQTQALQAGSPAIDHGGTSATGCPGKDQRGVARPDEAADNGMCDMGAYES